MGLSLQAFEHGVDQNGHNHDHPFESIVGSSAALKAVLETMKLVGPTNSTVLIQGETGTGKELVAEAIHNISSRSGRTFIKLNCAAIPNDLLESELFGHEKGAFTGAVGQRIGRFEMAHLGTLFLDEVGDLPLALQPKLLRVLQNRELERLGSGQTRRVDVRIIAATQHDLGELVRSNQFRSDLYYRLNVFPVSVPSLRDRPEDIPPLVTHFVGIFSRRMGKQIDEVSDSTMVALMEYHWPGNIRELQNLIERAVILAKDSVLPNPLLRPKFSRMMHPETERELILRALDEHHWVVGGASGAAARLGVKRTTLIARMKKLGIHRPMQLSYERDLLTSPPQFCLPQGKAVSYAS